MLCRTLSNAARSLRFWAVIVSLWVGAVHAAPFAYISNSSDGTVTVIDTATNNVVATVGVGVNPRGVAVSAVGTRAYVANRGSNSVSVIDTVTNLVVASVTVGTLPEGVAVNPAGTRAYVTNDGSSSVSVINTVTNSVIATVAVGSNPRGIAVNPAGTRAYVLNSDEGTVSVIDTATNSVVATFAGPTNGIAFNPAGTRVYLTGGGNVSVIDTATNSVVASVTVGVNPGGVAITPNGARVYVANSNSNSVSVIDTATNTVVSTVAVGLSPDGIAVNPEGTRAYVANVGSDSVSVINIATNTLVNTVTVGSSPQVFGLFIGQVLPVCYSAPSATGSGIITACFTGGGPGCSFSAPQYIGAPPGAAPIPPTTPGPGIVFPHGLFDFNTASCTPGSTLSFTITYPAVLPPGTVYWKYGPRPGPLPTGWYVLPATIVGNTATFTITDGGLGDDDLTANGGIVDQGGPGAGPGGATSVPTLSEWAMGLLALVLMGVAARRYRTSKR